MNNIISYFLQNALLVLLEGSNGDTELIPNQNPSIMPTMANDTQDLLDLLGKFFYIPFFKQVIY